MNGLKSLRERRLLTQGELAAAAGVGVATVSRVETGKVRPSLRTIRALAGPLGLSAEALHTVLLSRQQALL